jgi:hypothetical protein
MEIMQSIFNYFVQILAGNFGGVGIIPIAVEL